eukprot:747015-Pelagomonas_calceolata.AAC.3
MKYGACGVDCRYASVVERCARDREGRAASADGYLTWGTQTHRGRDMHHHALFPPHSTLPQGNTWRASAGRSGRMIILIIRG